MPVQIEFVNFCTVLRKCWLVCDIESARHKHSPKTWKFMQKPSKIGVKCSKIEAWRVSGQLPGGFWKVLGGFWTVLGSKRPLGWTVGSSRAVLGQLQSHLGVQVGPKLGPKTFKNPFRRPSQKWSYFWLVVGSGFVAIWCQLGSNLAAKTFPKSTQVGSKIHQKLDQDADQIFAWFLIGLVTLFC